MHKKIFMIVKFQKPCFMDFNNSVLQKELIDYFIKLECHIPLGGSLAKANFG